MSVMQKIREFLPHEDLIYFADSAYCPYGIRSPELVHDRAVAICGFLVSLGVKIVVVACNTISSVSLNELRRLHQLPIVGMEPAVKPAAAATKNKKVGIMATGITISGQRLENLLKRYGHGIEVVTQPCPGLVELVEDGKLEGLQVKDILRHYLQPLQDKGIDTLVLGCTHYPFLRPVIEEILGTGVQIIDTGEPVARRVVQVLRENNIIGDREKRSSETFYTSGHPGKVEEVIGKLWPYGRVNVKKAEV